MKIEVPKIVRDVRLAGYAEEFGEAAVRVWVNPPARLLDELIDCARRNPDETDEHFAGKAMRALEIYAELLSQDRNEETHWTRDELIELGGTDPTLWRWLRDQIWDELVAHRKLEKKR